MRSRVIALASLVALIALSVWGSKWAAWKDERVRVAIADLNLAQQETRDARAKAQRADDYAGKLMPVIDALRDSTEKWKARAADSKRRTDSLRNAFETVADAAPDTCQPVIQAARETILSQGLTIGSLQKALALSDSGLFALAHLVTDSLRPAIRDLIHADAKLDTAATNVAKEVRPKFLRRMVNAIADFGRPKLGLSATCGLDIHGKYNCVGGPSIGWTF